ncbi:MAG: hypothetical protein ACRER1_02435 [Gammaproteobacteria bacterium]
MTKHHVNRSQSSGVTWACIGILISLLLGSTGCSIVPPASIQYLESLPQGALQTAQPGNVRVAMNLPSDVRVTHFTVPIFLQSKNDNVDVRLQFVPVSNVEALAAPPTGAKGVWIYYKLTSAGLEEFKKIQAFLVRHPVPKGPPTVSISFSQDSSVQTRSLGRMHFEVALARCDTKGKVPLVAAILLDSKRGYVVVWDRAVALSSLAKPEDRICPSGSG